MLTNNNLITAFDPLNQNFINDPYPVYAALRNQDPVHRSSFGYWVLTRYEDVAFALKDPRLSNAPSRYAVTNKRNINKYTAASVASNIIPFMDPPIHSKKRRLISAAFNSHIINTPPDVGAICDRLLGSVISRGKADMIRDYGTPLSVSVISEVLGVPKKDESILREWSNWFFYLFSVIPSNEVLENLNRSLNEFREYLLDIVNARKAQPENDLITRLVQAGDEAQGLTTSEIIDTCMLFFADGVENVDSGLGNCLLSFLENKSTIDQLKKQPELLPLAINEGLRINPPGQYIAKIAKEDFVLKDKKIKKNDAVLIVLASANRDESVFPCPDRFVIDRSGNNHLSLGKGPHSCIGAPLVKIELNIAVKTLISRLNNLKCIHEAPVWEARSGHRWLKELPLSFSTP